MKFTLIILVLIIPNFLFSECIDLNEAECLYWSEYCEWNENTNQCQDIGGSGDGGGDGGGESNGPYNYLTISESQGLRNGPDYAEGVVY